MSKFGQHLYPRPRSQINVCNCSLLCPQYVQQPMVDTNHRPHELLRRLCSYFEDFVYSSKQLVKIRRFLPPPEITLIFPAAEQKARRLETCRMKILLVRSRARPQPPESRRDVETGCLQPLPATRFQRREPAHTRADDEYLGGGRKRRMI